MNQHRISIRAATGLFLGLTLASCSDDSTGIGNLPPSIEDVTVTVPKNESVTATVPVTDPEGDPLTFTLTEPPGHGTLQLTAAAGAGAQVTYTPFPGYDGPDSFVFSASDGTSSTQGRVNIDVINQPPTGLTGGTFERAARGDEPVRIEVSATDPDGDVLAFRVVESPRGGTVTEFFRGTAEGGLAEGGPEAAEPRTTTAVASYIPSPGFDGPDSFRVVATDGDGTSDPVTIQIIVNAVPVAQAVTATTERGMPVDVVLSATDADADPLRFEVVSGPTSGSLSTREIAASGGMATLTFTPGPNFTGVATFQYVARDSLDVSDPATARIAVDNTAPTAFSVNASTGTGVPVTIELSGTDPNGDALTFRIVKQPTGGTVSAPVSTGPTTARVTYTPGPFTSEGDAFNYVANDGFTNSPQAIVDIDLPRVDFVSYVTNELDDDVSVIDVKTGDVTGTFAVGTTPVHVEFSPDGSTALVVNAVSDDVSLVDVATDGVTATIAVGDEPVSATFTPDGAEAWVVNQSDDNISVIDMSTGTVTGTIAVGVGPHAVAFTPDGSTALVTNLIGDNVWIIDVATETMTGSFPAGSGPYEVEVAPSGDVAYVTNLFDSSVSVLNVDSGTVIGTIPVGGSPFSVAFTPDGSQAYVTSQSGDDVTVIDVSSGTVVGSIPVGDGPQSVAFTPDGLIAHVANEFDESVSVIDVQTGTVIDTITVGRFPNAVAITMR